MTEAARINALHTRAFGHPGAHGWREDDFQKALNDGAHECAASEQGYALARVLLDEAELLLIATVPEARKQGVAREAFSRLEDALRTRGVTRLFLEVVETNAPARAFYDRHGFTQIGQRDHYYGRGPGHGAILMEKALN